MTKPTGPAGAPSRPSAGSFLLLHVSFLIYSLVIVLSKTAAMQGWLTPTFFLFALFELLTLGFYALLWQQVLGRFKLVTAYANKGVVVVWNLIWAALLFGEQITPENLIGAALVVAGLVVVSSDAR
ncbi:MAG: transporter [Clostridiales Family XIII bacterium]|jgi:uncharacterized membrane protein|nr:transporter [Clostridiales Family XIII bacterium]